MIKIAIVSNSDREGGADRAAKRLHSSLNTDERMQSRMYVNNSSGIDSEVIVPGGKVSRFMKEMRPRLGRVVDPFYTNGPGGKPSISFFRSSWPDYLNNIDADIVHLHWPMNEMMSVKDISRIKKPLVWTLHDMWAFCGSEHYSSDNRYVNGYYRHNRPAVEKGFDFNRWTWNRKVDHWKNPFHIITPSRWMAECAKESKLMKEWPIQVIPNTIDTSFWKPECKGLSRDLLNLPKDKQLILFGSFGGTEDKRKGFDLLKSALTSITIQKDEIALVILGGKASEKSGTEFDFDTYHLGHFFDDLSLKVAYNAVDIVLLPSRQDNLPNMAVEAISCGVPVVAFDTGGIPDIIEHKKNGWLASPFDSNHLARGVEWVLKRIEINEEIALNARNKAIETYSNEVVNLQHLQYYRRVIQSTTVYNT